MIAAALLVGLLVVGAWFAAGVDRLAAAAVGEAPLRDPVLGPLRAAAGQLVRQRTTTEAPDAMNWALAPALYAGLAALGLSVVPLDRGLVAADLDAGIVLWGACEALTVVAVFLHGWSPNSPFPLLGAYRYVAIGLPIMLLSMFVLIAAALPAESLAVPAIVEAQAPLWNVVRQPLGLPLFLALGLSLTLRGPFDYADPFDLAGGTSAEDAGPQRAAWQLARLLMLVSVAAMASAAFLGGYLGPWLPGPLWLALKTAAVVVVLVVLGRIVPRPSPSTMLTLIWVVLLPLAFLGLAAAGVEALR